MSSIVQPPAQPPIPPQPPYVPPPRHRSFAGPLVLIVIGVIFLLGNMHMLSWARIGTWFAHYWPLLLILWGVVKMVEHQQARREGYRAPGIGAGGIFLIIMIVVFGLIATQMNQVNWSHLHDELKL